jgi:hypothetical protein
MECTKCSAICVNGDWYVDSGLRRYGPYLSKDIAAQVAISEALGLRRRQLPAKVSIRDGISGEVRVEYCLCSDFMVARQAQSASGARFGDDQ